jgi:predicted transcriptional regulator
MDNSLSNQYIADAIRELINLLGIKEDINYLKTKDLIVENKVEKCIREIANQLGLPIEVNLIVGGDFQTSGLSQTDSRGKGKDAIAAQVSIPSNLPIYGADNFKNIKIDVRISRNYDEHPLTFIGLMAHELSHILLHSLLHPQKENEFYTDLTAMIMGFTSVMEYGRKVEKKWSDGQATHTQTTIYGYLNDNQFDFARNQLNKILKKYQGMKRQILSDANKLRKICSKSDKTLKKIYAYLEYLDQNPQSNIRPKDAKLIVSFHQSGYFERYEKDLSIAKTTSGEAIKSYSRHYPQITKEFSGQIKKTAEKIQAVLTKSNEQENAMCGDLKVLKKYVGLRCRLKTAWSFRNNNKSVRTR